MQTLGETVVTGEVEDTSGRGVASWQASVCRTNNDQYCTPMLRTHALTDDSSFCQTVLHEEALSLQTLVMHCTKC